MLGNKYLRLMKKMINVDKYKEYAPIVIRIGISFVFLWFGISQLISPEYFLGYTPQWISSHSLETVHEHPFQFMHYIATPSINATIMANGIFETLLGLFLLLGIFTRIASLLLAVHLFFITLSLGYNDIAIRDFGLSIAAFSIFLYGHDKWSLDNKIKKLSKNFLLKMWYLFDKNEN